MKRVLAIAVAVCTLGVAGMSQIAIKGSWTVTACLLPSVTVSSTLGLTYTVAGFDFGTSWRFATTGLDRVSFTGKGAFGPFSISSRMWFNPAVPEYMGADLATSFDFGGVAIGLTVQHWDTDYNACFFEGTCWPFGPFYVKDQMATSPCPESPETPSYGMIYKFTTTIAPFGVTAYFVDCCTGIQLDGLYVTLTGVDLCCGIKYNAGFGFNKSGFQYLSLTGINIPLCCGVSFDVGITFTTTLKKLEVTPKFAGLGDGCFTIWADPISDGSKWLGLQVYGFRIRCTIADCNFIELIEAFDPDYLNTYILPSADQFSKACGEFEMLKLGFCGAGCCGGKYSVTLRVFFGTEGGIFDVTRIVYTVAIPIMTNFSLDLTGRIAASTCATQSFCIGWTFTF